MQGGVYATFALCEMARALSEILFFSFSWLHKPLFVLLIYALRNRFQKDTFGNCRLCSGLVFVNVNEVDVDYWVKMVAATGEGVGVGGSIKRLSMPNKAFNHKLFKALFFKWQQYNLIFISSFRRLTTVLRRN